jgi:hypothetical protein
MKTGGSAPRIARYGRLIEMHRLLHGGGRGIRTPGTLSSTAVFKTACFNRSHIPPREQNIQVRQVYRIPAIGNSVDGSCYISWTSPRTVGRFCRLTAELDEAELPKTGTPPRGDTT